MPKGQPESRESMRVPSCRLPFFYLFQGVMMRLGLRIGTSKLQKSRIYVRDRLGQFALAPDAGQNPQMPQGKENNTELAKFKDGIRHTLVEQAAPRMKAEYTEENFRKLFGEWNRVNTPVGRVTVPKKQFEKLLPENNKNKQDRRGWLGAMHQTITDPVIVIQEGPEKKLFVKTFAPEKKGAITFLSVIIEEGNSRVNISNHEKDMNNILNRIKKAGDVVYRKPTTTGVGSLTVGKSLRGVLPAQGTARTLASAEIEPLGSALNIPKTVKKSIGRTDKTTEKILKEANG